MALAELLLDGDQINITLRQIAEIARNTLTDIDEVSHPADGQAQTVVFTGRTLLAVDLRCMPYQAGQGPCLDAAKTGDTVVARHRLPGQPLPPVSPAAQRVGIHHSVWLGLPIPDRIVGALNMYAATRHPIPHDTVNLAEAFAHYAGVTVANVSTYRQLGGPGSTTARQPRPAAPSSTRPRGCCGAPWMHRRRSLHPAGRRFPADKPQTPRRRRRHRQTSPSPYLRGTGVNLWK